MTNTGDLLDVAIIANDAGGVQIDPGNSNDSAKRDRQVVIFLVFRLLRTDPALEKYRLQF